MTDSAHTARRVVTALLPSLSRSLAEQFNVFRVMHHGTHEKQISNVFAWLLDAEANHGLGDVAQRIFLDLVSASLPEGPQLPQSGYRIAQEVATRSVEDTAGVPAGDADAADIADIVLTRPDAAVVVENYGTSDGHGHDYWRYLAHGSTDGRTAAVVLLCQRRAPHLQRGGWERAAVVTYAEVLQHLNAHIADDKAWRSAHPDQDFFIRQMFEHFVEGPAAMNHEDTFEFLTMMCETGESARYGHLPRDVATSEFAELVAEHARRQFDDSRAALAMTKTRLREFSRTPLVDQVNSMLSEGPIEEVTTRFSGQWEWTVALRRASPFPAILLQFGPTAVVEQQRALHPLEAPDYACLVVTLGEESGAGTRSILQTDVRLREVVDGLAPEDTRLRDAVLHTAGLG